MFGQPSEKLFHFFEVQVLTGPGQRLTVGLAITKQVTLVGFEDLLGNQQRRWQIGFEAP